MASEADIQAACRRLQMALIVQRAAVGRALADDVRLIIRELSRRLDLEAGRRIPKRRRA